MFFLGGRARWLGGGVGFGAGLIPRRVLVASRTPFSSASFVGADNHPPVRWLKPASGRRALRLRLRVTFGEGGVLIFCEIN